MEARRFRAASIAVLACALLGANYRTTNFSVQTADGRQAEVFAKTAEKLRHDLALDWLGQAMPDWFQPCTITVQVGVNLGAGGATTFLFDRGEVYGWRMNIQGSAQRIVDSVLPHEITHMVFASYFRAPLPRWADEGGATNVECPSERAKHQRMLVQFLRTGRGIAFSEMFRMTEYPPDVMPLYAQAHSLADYLIQQGGRRRYAEFLVDGMREQQWPEALSKWYGISDLGSLQNRWVDWVGKGSPALRPGTVPERSDGVQLASSRAPRPTPNLLVQSGRAASARPVPDMVPVSSATTIELSRPQPVQRPNGGAIRP